MTNPGMTPAVQQALERRGMGASMQSGQGALTQVSPGAAMQNPVPQPTNAPSASGQSAVPAAPQDKFIPKTQEDFIVAALTEQLKNSHSLKKEEMKMAQGAAVPMGGGQMITQPQPQKRDYFSLSTPGMNETMANSNKQSSYPF